MAPEGCCSEIAAAATTAAAAAGLNIADSVVTGFQQLLCSITWFVMAFF